MEMDQGVLEKMKHSVLDGEEGEAVALAEKALEDHLDLFQVMNYGFLKGIQEAGELYQEGEYFLPELVCAADAMKAALGVLAPALSGAAGVGSSKGKVVMATVQGDVHDIGKLIVASLLTAGGYDVIDLGSDVPNECILETIQEKKPDIVGLSALLTTTMEEQRNVIDLLNREGLKDNVKVIVGGAPVSSRWAETIKADGYSDNAIDAVKLVDRLLR